MYRVWQIFVWGFDSLCTLAGISAVVCWSATAAAVNAAVEGETLDAPKTTDASLVEITTTATRLPQPVDQYSGNLSVVARTHLEQVAHTHINEAFAAVPGGWISRGNGQEHLTALRSTVAVHAHGAEGMKRAVKAGVDSVEHGTYVTNEVMKLMKKKGTYFVPTISAVKWAAEKADTYPAIVQPKARAVGPKIQATFAKAYKKGVKIAFGTDAGIFPHGLNSKEFIYMTEAGMPAMEAIQSATSIAAKLLRINDTLGSIESGKIADIIAVKGNPLDDIELMSKVNFVMKDGVVYKHER